MPELDELVATAARERAAAIVQRSARPSQRRDRADAAMSLRSPYRASSAAAPAVRAQFTVERAASAESSLVRVAGYASAYEQPYRMWDYYGEYTEVVTAGAGATSLAAGPDVKFLFNHRDMPMARHFPGEDQTETEGRLLLSEDDHGLVSVAYPLMTLTMSQQVVAGIEAGLIDEMSYAFTITRGTWSADYTEYRIHEYDIHRGDTSAVTYGANPYTEISVQREADEPTVHGLCPAQKAAARNTLFSSLTR